ncbi:MAG: DUF2007 domain-containing protein [Bacteroidales bacterium]|nr:DUF2007 domain-containing protein [Bacteroidales bacterium]
MTPKTESFLKKVLAYGLMSVTLMLIYFVIAFVIDQIFNLFGGEDGVSIITTIATCIVLTAIFVVGDIINSRQKDMDRSDDIIKICRRILTTTTYMFCGMLLVEWLIQKFSDKDFSLGLVHWLSFALAVALFDELIKKNKKMQEDENALVVVAECEDMQTAEDICNKLESNGIKAMIVDKDSPVYIKGNDSPVQIQVCRKDLEEANAIIQQ